jgi:PAS domain S-box-containing protein
LTAESNDSTDFLAEGGEMGARIRAFDWTTHSLGSPQQWPQALRTSIRLMLTTGHPVLIFWGVELCCFYNDAFARYLGPEKHPAMLGAPGREMWQEVWPVVGAQIEGVMRGQPAIWKEDQLVPIFRHGRLEEVYWTYSYSPIDHAGGVGGVLVLCSETTSLVLHARERQALSESESRFRFLFQLTEATKEATDPETIMSTCARMLGQHLQASVCAYADMEPDQDGFTIRGDWSAPGAASIVGYYSLAGFGTRAVENLRAGRPLVTNDTLEELGPAEAALFLQLGLRATICMPLIKQGRLIALMAVHHAAPHPWTFQEQALIGEVTERCWAHIERVRSEAERRLSEQRFRGAVDAMQGTLWTNDAQGRMKGQQLAWSVLTGQRFEEYQDLGWATAVHPEDAQPTIHAWRQAVAQRKTFEFEHRVKRAFDGAWRRYAIRAIPLLDEEGQTIEWVGVHTDITERRAAEEALRDADRRKDEFIATLAHELRNPLAPIRNAAQVAKSPGATDAQRRWAHEVIERQARHMALLLEDLLDVSRITRGTLQLRLEPVELAAVVDTAIETARPLIDSRQHELTVVLPEAPLWLEADALRLAQVLSNLLTNAAKYSEPQGEIRLSAEQRGEELTIRVSDRGLGIEPQLLPRIFEMFSQGKPAIDRAEGGLGIGLALVKGLLGLHGGTIEASSAGIGQGSTFTVRLPISRHAQRAGSLDAAEGVKREQTRTRRVLVVDDNRDSAESLALLLSLQGHEIRCAHSGAEALEVASEFRPQMVLLDIGMPHMNGYEVAARIRAQTGGREIMLVAVTGWGQTEDKRRASEAGFDQHLVKPIGPQDLAKLFADSSRG